MNDITKTIRLPHGTWAEIRENDGIFSLVWGDAFNTWDEKFPSISCAFLRLAMLAKCAESLDSKFFKISENGMAAFSEKFFSEVLS